jgi:iron complex transport system substrate-binding protein
VKALWIFVALAILGCAAAPQRSAQVQTGAPQRIISLVPSLTEDLCAIGARHQLVGVSTFSDDIPCARGIPQVSNFAGVDSEEAVRLRPDVVVGIPAQRAITAQLRSAGVRTAFFSDDSYSDLFADIAGLGSLSGHAAESRALIASLRRRTAELQSGERFRRRPSVFFVAQALPLWTIGPRSYIATLVDLAGGRIATQVLRVPYAQYSTEALIKLDPDAIVATSDAHLEAVLDRMPWRALRAVREHRVFILQNGALLVRPGPRYNEGLSWLIERLRPVAI